MSATPFYSSGISECTRSLSELLEREAFAETFIRDIVVMPGKATIHYKVPIVTDSPKPEGDS